MTSACSVHLWRFSHLNMNLNLHSDLASFEKMLGFPNSAGSQLVIHHSYLGLGCYVGYAICQSHVSEILISFDHDAHP